MADDKKTLKFQMMMSPGEAKDLDDWMFANRIRSRAEAIRRLCQIGVTFEQHLTTGTLGHLENMIGWIDAQAEDQIELLGEIKEEEGSDASSPSAKQVLWLSIQQLLELWDHAHLLELNLREVQFAINRIKTGPRSKVDLDIRKFSEEIDKKRDAVIERLKAAGYVGEAPGDAE